MTKIRSCPPSKAWIALCWPLGTSAGVSRDRNAWDRDVARTNWRVRPALGTLCLETASMRHVGWDD